MNQKTFCLIEPTPRCATRNYSLFRMSWYYDFESNLSDQSLTF